MAYLRDMDVLQTVNQRGDRPDDAEARKAGRDERAREKKAAAARRKEQAAAGGAAGGKG